MATCVHTQFCQYHVGRIINDGDSIKHFFPISCKNVIYCFIVDLLFLSSGVFNYLFNVSRRLVHTLLKKKKEFFHSKGK